MRILLKKSLSMTLIIFYPLVGRINNYSYVDCNDEGALFIEAKANCQLSDILLNRNQYHNHRFKFAPQQAHKGIHQYGSLFQLTYFTCGGLALSFAMPHMIGDALSIFIFLNRWAAVARENTNVNMNMFVDIPTIGSASIFPPNESFDVDMTQLILDGKKIITKSFLFDAFTIADLRDKYNKDGEKLSRVQALSVFLLSRVNATISQAKESGSVVVSNSVNLRPFLSSPISKHSFGNLAWMGVVRMNNMESMGNEDKYCCEIGMKIKDFIKSVNEMTVKKFQSDDRMNLLKEAIVEFAKGYKFSFSSLCNFPIYEIDFGWGKPEWVVVTGVILDNVLIFFVDTKEWKDIEAWITMTEEDMAKFEVDNKLLSCLSSIPNGNQSSIKQSRL